VPDLSRLSDAERRILALLARGHTAKSAANTLGVTEAAINERLREARRKTGVGSSRELARLAFQENRDEEIGVASADQIAEARVRPSPPRPSAQIGWPMLFGALAMIVLASVIGGFTALALSGQAAPLSPPRVVATYPAAGAVVPAGRLTLKVTFDRPMRASWSFVSRDAASTPPCDGKPVRSADGRSFSMTCQLAPGRTYWIGFNSASHRNFASPDGVPATPAGLAFSTK